MQRLKHPTGLCLLAGLVLGLAFGRFRAAQLLGAPLWKNWPLLIPAAVLALLAYMAKDPPPAAECRPSGFKVVEILAGFCLFGAASLALMGRDGSPLSLVSAIFPILCGFGVILSASDKGGDLPGLGSVIPVFYQGYLLLQLYRANATDTHRATFAMELFCVIAILLSIYGAASARFLPYGRLRNCLFGGLGLYAAGLMLVPCVLAGDYVFGLTWLNGTLLLAQAGLALHGAASTLFPPPPEAQEEEEEPQEEEEAEESSADEQEYLSVEQPDTQKVDNDSVVSEERNPR